MVVTGLTLLFGGRADPGGGAADPAGPGSRAASCFPRIPRRGSAPPTPVRTPDDDGSYLARTVSAEGRSRAFLGGRSVPVGVVAELAEAARRQPDRPAAAVPARRAAPCPGPVRRRRDLELLDRCTAPPISGGGSSAPTSSAAAARRASWPRPPTCSGTASEIESHAPEPGEDDALDTQAKRLGDADALRAAADEAR